jgi:hypothetical protein
VIAFSDLITEIVENKVERNFKLLQVWKPKRERYNERIILWKVVTEQKTLLLKKQDDWDLYFAELESLLLSGWDCPVKPTKKRSLPRIRSTKFCNVK